MTFSYFYTNIMLVTAIMIPLLTLGKTREYFSFLITIFLIPLYLFGMSRSFGVDVENYRRLYETNDSFVDVGFNLLMLPFQITGVPFEIFLFSLGIFNIVLVYKITKKLEVNFGVVLFILLLHLIIVRDFAQLRAGLAINISMYAYFCRDRWKYLTFGLAISVHLTVVILVVILMAYKIFEKRRMSLSLLTITLLIWPIISLNLIILADIDPRIELYMSWQRPGYGESVHTYVQPLFVIFLLLIYLLQNSKNLISLKLIKMDIFIFSLLHALVIFVSFSQYAIFAYRLTNVAISLYPFFIASITKNHNSSITYRLCVLASLVLILDQRSNKDAIIDSIGVGM
jgi:hypothetical protein